MKLYPSQGKQTIKKKSYPIIHQMLISFMNKKVSGESNEGSLSYRILSEDLFDKKRFEQRPENSERVSHWIN